MKRGIFTESLIGYVRLNPGKRQHEIQSAFPDHNKGTIAGRLSQLVSEDRLVRKPRGDGYNGLYVPDQNGTKDTMPPGQAEPPELCPPRRDLLVRVYQAIHGHPECDNVTLVRETNMYSPQLDNCLRWLLHKDCIDRDLYETKVLYTVVAPLPPEEEIDGTDPPRGGSGVPPKETKIDVTVTGEFIKAEEAIEKALIPVLKEKAASEPPPETKPQTTRRFISAPWRTMLEDEVKQLKAEKSRLKAREAEIDLQLSALYASAMKIFD